MCYSMFVFRERKEKSEICRLYIVIDYNSDGGPAHSQQIINQKSAKLLKLIRAKKKQRQMEKRVSEVFFVHTKIPMTNDLSQKATVRNSNGSRVIAKSFCAKSV